MGSNSQRTGQTWRLDTEQIHQSRYTMLRGPLDFEVARRLGWPTDLAAHLELMIVGGLIITFLILEPHGLAQLWRVAKEKLRLWPFPH